MDGRAAAPPASFAELRETLRDGGIRLPRRLKQVAAFALAQPDEIAFGTVAGIAARAEVQPSTLVRFAQALGFAGFSELQALFRTRLRDQVSSYDERLLSLRTRGGDASRAATLLDGFCESAGRSIASMHDAMDLRLVEEAARVLGRAETIYLVAQRRSYPVTAYLSYVFGKLGVRNVLIGSAPGVDAETISFATARDAALAVSFSPYASTTIDLAGRAAALGVPLVVITDSPFSPLAGSDRILFEVVETDFEGFRSLSATMALAVTLAVAVAGQRRDAVPPQPL